MSFAVLIGIGAAAGAVFALIFGTRPAGWLSLMLVPIGTIFWIYYWQNTHLESLRSTSALDYVFITPVPLVGALMAYGMIFFTKLWLETRRL
ncbi:MAG: hypothetical protein A2792_17010 [Sphingomonadales bacterium RIFCSPHIGHO2_01_FULL_65_20]|uniref:hypothetical protein n=1 Tax=Blastomonas TaxID=150203 RepID=UPI00082E7AAB|nr:hypothetical protein [Sphingomonas ursincola]MBA4778943.1 hypothetical protein [Blastomonas sp.]MBY0620574.1 hypothetical protein [Sphingomonas ursincola]MCH2239439.1 hypothetical protein [Blastomonas sp.]OHC92461.1 MAG: hypothetical protein A2792_17010 [Sphingomonadales bacterium RIFCSPHIGHO2_01_FULL_65_20]